MTHPARTDGSHQALGRHVAARSLIAPAFLLAVTIALGAASPSLAGRIWSDAASVRATVSQGLFHVRYQRGEAADVARDDYVQGLARLRILEIPGVPDTRADGD